MRSAAFRAPEGPRLGIFTSAFEESVWARIGARVEPMLSEEKILQALADDDETAAAEATITAEWSREAAEGGAQNAGDSVSLANARGVAIVFFKNAGTAGQDPVLTVRQAKNTAALDVKVGDPPRT